VPRSAVSPVRLTRGHLEGPRLRLEAAAWRAASPPTSTSALLKTVLRDDGPRLRLRDRRASSVGSRSRSQLRLQVHLLPLLLSRSAARGRDR
jgi:hypothetical protein